ncbi:putative pectinesterase [Iris pallida]|uniref:Pectinesterase n=1 Tax=Iris pallida TaxID=29817 RepID=A0AAX6E7W8_IRIPA|nr:putative pectinesterase [Iris pallida]
MLQLYTTARSAPTRSATAWCFSGPARFSIVMSFIMNPAPVAAALTNSLTTLEFEFPRSEEEEEGVWLIHTESGGVKCSIAVRDAAEARHDGLVLAVADEHEVGLLPSDFDVLFVPAGLDVDDDAAGAGLGCGLHRVADFRVAAAAVLRHDHIRLDPRGRHLQQPPVARLHPSRKTARRRRRRQELPLLVLDGDAGEVLVPARGREDCETVASQLRQVLDMALHLLLDVPIGDAVQAFGAGVVVGQCCTEPSEHVLVGSPLRLRRRRARLDYTQGPRELVHGRIEELHAVLVGGPGVRVHRNAYDRRCAIHRASDSAQRHVDGNVDQVALRGIRRPGEIEERAHAELGVAREAAGPRDGLRRPGSGQGRPLRPGPGPSQDGDRCGGSRQEQCGEEADEDEPSPPPAARDGLLVCRRSWSG